jgi:DNA-binding SARP family transcriptional activator
LIGLGRHEEALRIAEEHASTIALSTFHQYRVNLVRARFPEAGGDRQGAALSCRAAVTLARDHGYDHWLSEEAAKSPKLFALLRADPTLGDYFAKIAPRPERAVSVPLAEPLRVKCLGSFSLAVGDRLVDDSAWRSSKALRIFQVLLIKGARGFVPIELLLEFAWPETAPDVGRRRFHVAMTSLRKVLEPGLQRGTPSCYIIRRHDAYRVAVGAGGDVDFLAFDRAVRAAKQAIGSGNPEAALEPLLRAVDLYRGPLLAEFPFEDAIRSERTALEQAFRSALGDLLKLYERKQAWERCAGVAERYLDHDPLAEPMYRRLMRYHASRGDRAAVTRVFERCRENLARELGVGLSDDTLRLRRTLFESY